MPPRRARRTLCLLATYGVAAAAFLVVHAAFGRLAALAEREEGAYLYSEEEWLHPLAPDLHLATDRPMISVFGPSEIREGLLVDDLQARFPGWRVHQDALSQGTSVEAGIFLDLLEAQGGKTARPAVLLLALTPRFVLGHQDEGATPFLDAIDRYSASFGVDRSGAAPVLVRKGPWPAARSQLAWWSAQTRRYRHALRAFVPRVFGWFGRKSPLGPGRALAPPKFHHWTPTDKAPYTTPEFLESYETLRVLAAWDPATEGRLPKQWLADLRRLCDERGIRLFAFLHPQASWSRRTWCAERHQAFEELCHQALADRPLLDLRTLLADSDYFDFVHPNREGARRLTQRLGEFLASHID